MLPFFVAKIAVLSATSTGSKPELQKIVLPPSSPSSTLDLLCCQRSNVILLSSRANCAFKACGCTSPMAWSNRAVCFCPASTTREFACPAAATPNAAVRSRYFLPSASQTCTPFARSQTIGHEPSASMKVTFCDSYFRSNLRTSAVVIGCSDAAFFRRPNDFVQLHLKTNGQGVRDYPLGQLLPRNRCLAYRDLFQR